LTINVAGSGLAGYAFGIAAAGMGHKVTLYDQDDKIGGQFHTAKRVTGKRDLHATLRYFENHLEAMGVYIHAKISYQDKKEASDVDK
jgi:2,4-dienoyl-CoA reductase (NADPH2)